MTFEPCYDLLGVGLGPFNLALAALAEPIPGLRALFLDENPCFRWHPGMMVEGATLQVPFLADLVTLVDPANPHSYLAYLRDTGRLFEFYFAERFHIPRAEYESYCRAVAQALATCRFGFRVTAVEQATLPDGHDGFEVTFANSNDAGGVQSALAANVVLGVGTEPVVPDALSVLWRDAGPSVCHSAHYLDHADLIRAADDVTVVGSGQSGAEVVLDLLRTWHRPGRRLRWLTRSTAFEPMEYSKLGLEHFTPDYVDYFHDLPLGERAALLSAQGRLYKAVSADTLAAIRDELDTRSFRRGISDTGVTLMPGVEAVGASRADNALKVVLALRHRSTGEAMTVRTERLVLATGYAPREPRCLAPLDALIERDAEGRFIIERDHRVRTTGTRVGLYVQNAELHTHGVGTPDLGLGAYRAAEILNAVTGRPVYPLPSRTAHIAFAPTVAAAADPGIALDLEDPGHEQHRSQYQPAESGGPGAAVPLRHRAQHAAQPRRVDAIPAR